MYDSTRLIISCQEFIFPLLNEGGSGAYVSRMGGRTLLLSISLKSWGMK